MATDSALVSHNLPIGSDACVYVPNDERDTLEIHDLLQRFAGPECDPLATARAGDDAGFSPR